MKRLLAFTIFLLLVHPQAISGIALGGAFYTYTNIQVPQGSVINASGFYITVYNHNDHEVRCELDYEAPNGINITFAPPERVFTVNAQGYRRVYITLQISKDVVPGDYEIWIRVSEVRETEPGHVVVIPADARSIVVRVTGEYGFINAVAVDPAGNVVELAVLRLFRKVDSKELNILDSKGGRLSAKVSPGWYVVKAFLSGELAGQAEVYVQPFQTVNVTIPLRIVYFEFFDVVPVKTSRFGKMAAARIVAVIKNLYRPIQDASVVLRVERNGAVVEDRYFLRTGVLPVGRSEYRLDYVPPGGWKAGTYSFKMFIYGYGNRTLATSDTKYIEVSPFSLPIVALGISIPLAAAGILCYLGRRKIMILEVRARPRSVAVEVLNASRRDILLREAKIRRGRETVAKIGISTRLRAGRRREIRLKLDEPLEEGSYKVSVRGGGFCVSASRKFTLRRS